MQTVGNAMLHVCVLVLFPVGGVYKGEFRDQFLKFLNPVKVLFSVKANCK